MKPKQHKQEQETALDTWQDGIERAQEVASGSITRDLNLAARDLARAWRRRETQEVVTALTGDPLDSDPTALSAAERASVALRLAQELTSHEVGHLRLVLGMLIASDNSNSNGGV